MSETGTGDCSMAGRYGEGGGASRPGRWAVAMRLGRVRLAPKRGSGKRAGERCGTGFADGGDHRGGAQEGTLVKLGALVE